MSKHNAITIDVTDVRPALIDTVNAIALRAMYAPIWMQCTIDTDTPED